MADRIAGPDAGQEVRDERPSRGEEPPARGSAGFSRHLPFLAATLFYAILLLGCLFVTHARTGGKLIYALDDAYIHMATAKTLVRHGIWGVSEGPWSGVSSSPAYTLLLAGVYRLFGVNDLAPLLLNVLFSLGVIWVAHVFLRRHAPRLSPWAQTLLLGLAVFVTSLPGLTLVGMEHTLQCLLILAVLLWGLDLAQGGRVSWPFALLCTLAVLVRFESVFFLWALAVLLLVRRRVGAAVLLVFLSGLPVALYALVSLHAGGPALPNSVLLKGLGPHRFAGESVLAVLLPLRFVTRCIEFPREVVPALMGIVAGLVALREQRGSCRGLRALLLVQGMVVFLHFQFSGMGGGGRYEAYLALTSVLVLASAVEAFHAKALLRGVPAQARRLRLLIIALSIFVLAERGVWVLHVVCAGSTNIYQQQFQMGRFLREHYQGAAVAANDIGAINYLADIRCIDLWGLATTEIARLKLADSFDTGRIDEITRREGAAIAVIYDSWYRGGRKPPDSWVRVATWTIPDNVICANDTVSFYAVAPGEEEALRRKLALFAPRLPPGVQVRH